MKNFCLLFLFILSHVALAQTGGFNTNGLLYSDAAVTALKGKVDSLHSQFGKQTERNVYNSVPEAYYAHYIKMQGKKSVDVKKDIEAGLAYNEIITKYPDLFVIDSTLALRCVYKNYKEEDVLRINMMSEGRAYNLYVEFEGVEAERYKTATQGWLYSYDAPGSEYGENTQACYITVPLTSVPIKEEYARLIQYSEFLVKTTTVFYDDAKRNDVFFGDEPGEEMAAFLEYTNVQLGRPAQRKDEDDEGFYKRMEEWEVVKWEQADHLYVADGKFKRLLILAYNKTHKGDTNNDFEDYIAHYYTVKTALEYKRSRIVFGSCTRNGPQRRHAVNIAKLAAETVNWDVFMCAHLNIMNDNFESIEAKNRFTYVKELEAIGINVGDLIIGINLKINNAPENHYYGDINELGLVITEAKDREAIAQKLLYMIQDKDLDLYNRWVMCCLYLSYNRYIQDGVAQKQNKKLFDNAVVSLPLVVSQSFKDNKDIFFFER